MTEHEEHPHSPAATPHKKAPRTLRDESFGLIAIFISVLSVMVGMLQYRAARDAVRQSHQDVAASLESSQRAYMYIASTLAKSGLSLKEPAFMREPPSIELKIKVLGPTPALSIDIASQCGVSTRPEPIHYTPPKNTDFNWNGDARHHLLGVLFPGTDYDVTCPLPGIPHLNGSSMITESVRVRGDIHYTDVFHQQHTTGFCYDGYISVIAVNGHESGSEDELMDLCQSEDNMAN